MTDKYFVIIRGANLIVECIEWQVNYGYHKLHVYTCDFEICDVGMKIGL